MIFDNLNIDYQRAPSQDKLTPQQSILSARRHSTATSPDHRSAPHLLVLLELRHTDAQRPAVLVDSGLQRPQLRLQLRAPLRHHSRAVKAARTEMNLAESTTSNLDTSTPKMAQPENNNT